MVSLGKRPHIHRDPFAHARHRPLQPSNKSVAGNSSVLGALVTAEEEITSSNRVSGRAGRLQRPIQRGQEGVEAEQEEEAGAPETGTQGRVQEKSSQRMLARGSHSSKASSSSSRAISANPSTSSIVRAEQRSRAEGTRSVAAIGATVTSAGDWQTNVEPK